MCPVSPSNIDKSLPSLYFSLIADREPVLLTDDGEAKWPTDEKALKADTLDSIGNLSW
jgi:hypothetical protein